jgi:hypothetical protein
MIGKIKREGGGLIPTGDFIIGIFKNTYKFEMGQFLKIEHRSKQIFTITLIHPNPSKKSPGN